MSDEAKYLRETAGLAIKNGDKWMGVVPEQLLSLLDKYDKNLESMQEEIAGIYEDMAGEDI
jgi:hypothetical protein